MDKEEWLTRYAARLKTQADLTDEPVSKLVDPESFEDMSDFFEDDPEGAADEELSCWEPD